MSKEKEILKKIGQTGIVPLIYHSDKDLVAEIVATCYKAGVRAFEFTDRGADALPVFKHLVAVRPEKFPELVLGIGSILDTERANEYLEAGTDFIVAPVMDPEVGKWCASKGLPWVPGCGTLTEIVMARKAGAGLCKIFPGNVLGASFVKGVLGPCPDLVLMPTGGVTTEVENLTTWFNAGVFCVGLGSQLFTKEVVAEKDFDKLLKLLQDTVANVSKIKNA